MKSPYSPFNALEFFLSAEIVKCLRGGTAMFYMPQQMSSGNSEINPYFITVLQSINQHFFIIFGKRGTTIK
jgi:hypothetical protein